MTARERQYFQALELANMVRQRRAGLKRDLHAGRLSAALVVAQPPEFAQSMSVMDVLLALPHVGRVKALKLLKRTGIGQARTLGELSVRQRGALASIIGTPEARVAELEFGCSPRRDDGR